MKIDLKSKKSILILVISIIVIVLIVIGTVCITNSNSNKLVKLYDKLENSEKYLFEMKQSDGYQIKMAKNGNATSIDMESEDMHTTTLVKDQKAYFINHDEKIYSVYNEATANENILFDEFDKVKEKAPLKGKEKINGKSYNYEEYAGYSGFMYSSNIDVEEENIKTKFYFEGNNLKYIKTIITNQEEELIEVNLTYDPANNLFEIPEEYKEM